MTTPTIEQQKDFCKRAVVKWHENIKSIETHDTLLILCSCGEKFSSINFKHHVKNNPDLSDPRVVLEIMRSLGEVRYNKFMQTIAISTDLVFNDNFELVSFTWCIKSEFIVKDHAMFWEAYEELKKVEPKRIEAPPYACIHGKFGDCTKVGDACLDCSWKDDDEDD